MPEAAPDAAEAQFQYAIIRVVPRVERGECLNAGVILLCRPKRFLAARVALDEARLRALAPGRRPGDDPDAPRGDRADRGRRRGRRSDRRLSTGRAVPLARRRRRARSSSRRRSTPGLCDDPAAELDHLFERLVR